MKLRLRITDEQLKKIQYFLANKKQPIGILGEGHNTEKIEFSYGIKKISAAEIDSEKINGTRIFFRNNIEVAQMQNDLDGFKRKNTKYQEVVICYLLEQDICAFYLAGDVVQSFDVISVVGQKIDFFFRDQDIQHQEMNRRTEQMFGAGTVSTLQKLKVGIVGISGTGSIVAEQMLRLGIGELVLVDDDIIEEKNLNRILNSTKQDAINGISKVKMFERHIRESGLETKVTACNTVVANPRTIKELSQCDVLFGCMDSVDGRHHLNLLSTYYTIPYFDVGVKLVADGGGGIDEITTASHYVKPGGSSLMSRHVYNSETLTAASLKRNDPKEYKSRLQEKYIVGAQESSPAVISVNMLAASIVVLDFLSKIHQYRSEEICDVETVRMDLVNLRVLTDDCSESCSIFNKFLGKGNENSLLESLD